MLIPSFYQAHDHLNQPLAVDGNQETKQSFPIWMKQFELQIHTKTNTGVTHYITSRFKASSHKMYLKNT